MKVLEAVATELLASPKQRTTSFGLTRCAKVIRYKGVAT